MEALRRSVAETKGRKRTPAKASNGKKAAAPKRRAAARK